MKKIKISIGIVALLSTSITSIAQNNNLVMNGSFESTHGSARNSGTFKYVDSISSSNNTTIDLYSKDACGKDNDVPANYMGTQESKSGNNYAGIIAYYADDAGIFRTKPGYRKYSEYIQFTFREPLVAGKAYNLTFNASLAEKSAYAVSGMGFHLSKTKVDVQNNSFLELTPQVICPVILNGKEWTTFTSIYVATGGERYLTLGCFENFMEIQKVIPEFTHNSRKAYYFIDDVSVAPAVIPKEDITGILAGECFQLNNLNFELDKAIILSESFNELNSLSNFLKTYPYIEVYIDGHTDKSGSNAHNEKLSEARATAVKDYLINAGVSKKRLKARGFGESLPMDDENNALNRRVEITICGSSIN